MYYYLYLSTMFIFKVGTKIKEAWVLYKEHFVSLILLLLVSGAFQMLSQGFPKHHKNFLITLIAMLISVFISYVWTRSILGLLDGKGFNPFTKESLPTLEQYWNLLKTCILVVICTMFGFILLIVPGLYIAGRLFPAIYLSVEKNQGARKSMKEAWEMTHGNGWKILGKSILIGLFAILGFVALFIGYFITYPIAMIVTAMMYRELAKLKSLSNPIVTEVVKEEGKIEEKSGEVKEEVK